ncbi:hypothetical protein EMIT0P253_10443 [Pseudomonas sp. IT-P253]
MSLSLAPVCFEHRARQWFHRGIADSPPVGASLLAMDVNEDAGCLDEHGALTFIASKLALIKQKRISGNPGCAR